MQEGSKLCGKGFESVPIRIGLRRPWPVPDAPVQVEFLSRRRLPRGPAPGLQGLEAGYQRAWEIRRHPPMPDEDHGFLGLPAVLTHVSTAFVESLESDRPSHPHHVTIP